MHLGGIKVSEDIYKHNNKAIKLINHSKIKHETLIRPYIEKQLKINQKEANLVQLVVFFSIVLKNALRQVDLRECKKH